VSTIEIEGDLAKKIIRLKATGNVAWAIAIAAIGMAVVVLIVGTPATVATGGLGAPLEITRRIRSIRSSRGSNGL
jgi:hypothetical protein